MTLNINKRALQQASFGRNSPPPPVIIADDEQVTMVTSMTLLGVTLHQSLKWDTHIEGIITKGSTEKYFLITLKRSWTTCKQLPKFYTTFLRPGLKYATPRCGILALSRSSQTTLTGCSEPHYASSIQSWAINVLWKKPACQLCTQGGNTLVWTLHTHYTTTRPSTTGSNLRGKTSIISQSKNQFLYFYPKMQISKNSQRFHLYFFRLLSMWTLLEPQRKPSSATLSGAANQWYYWF